MEEDCGGDQGLSWVVEPRRERERSYLHSILKMYLSVVHHFVFVLFLLLLLHLSVCFICL
jgi:hypothetical protein